MDEPTLTPHAWLAALHTVTLAIMVLLIIIAGVTP